MGTFLVTFLVFLLVVIAMAVGVIISNREIKGSCGGLGSINGLESACDICKSKSKCKRRKSMETD